MPVWPAGEGCGRIPRVDFENVLRLMTLQLHPHLLPMPNILHEHHRVKEADNWNHLVSFVFTKGEDRQQRWSEKFRVSTIGGTDKSKPPTVRSPEAPRVDSRRQISSVRCVCVGGNDPHPPTMRCMLGFCVVALPIAASFTVRSAVHSPPVYAPCQKQSSSKDSIMFSDRRRRTRRNAGEGGGPVNLDSSDDAPEADDEIYASLRRRLEELEKSAPIVPEEEG